MAGAFIERCLATHYVEDYERHPRRYIGYYCLLTFPISLVITIPVFMGRRKWADRVQSNVSEWIHWGLLIVVDVSCGFLAAWVYLSPTYRSSLSRAASSFTTGIKGITSI